MIKHAAPSNASRTSRSGEPGPMPAGSIALCRSVQRWAPGLPRIKCGVARGALISSAIALSACATALPQIVPGEPHTDTFAVRYDQNLQTQAEVDAAANANCANGAAGYVSQETRFDGFAYRTYRCARR